MEANGVPAPPPDQSPFARVALSVDSYTLDAASGKRRVRAIEPDGTLTYDEPKPPKVKYGDDLNRIWNEYPGGLVELSEEKLEDVDEVPTVDEEKADESEREKGELLNPEEMEALRSEVCNDLNNARNELWYVFELAKTLAASAGIPSDPPPEPIPSAPVSKKGKQKAAAATTPAPASTPVATPAGSDDGPILPAGTYSATPGAPPTRSDVDIAHALELAIAAKQQALDDCSALIDAAVDELRLLNSASDQWTSDLRTLRLGDNGRGQWATVPKPDFARSHTETAKDVVVPYALDEAPVALHARSLAAFDLDPHNAHILQFGARSYFRLRVLVRTGGTGGPRIGSLPYSCDGESGRGVRAMMEAAQVETLDEDLFNEIRAEALRVDSAMVEHQSVALPLGKEKITFQLYDTREAPSPAAPHSPICDALLAQARLGLLHAYRRRKQRVIDISAPAGVPPPPTSILVPLVHIMQFRGVCASVSPVLEVFRAALASAGLTAALVQRHAAAGNPHALFAFLSAKAKIDVLGTVYTLEVSGCPGITVNITAPSSISVVTQRASFVLRDLDSLGAIVAETLTAQLGPMLYKTVCGLMEEDSRAFYDELDGVVILDVYGPLSLSFEGAHMSAAFEAGPSYDSRDGGSLVDWLGGAVKALPKE